MPIIDHLVRAGLSALSRTRLPQTDGTVNLPGLAAPVEVLRDRWGVPHLYAENRRDLMLAQGFVHAQDRLWQMDVNRRLVAGRLAEIVGAPALKSDRWMRTLTLRRVAEQEAAALDGDVRDCLEAYAAGVNACIARGRLPVEFTLLGYKPEPWRPADSLSWIKMMSLDLSVNWQSEALRAQMIAWLGADRAAEIDRAFPGDQPAIVPPGVDCARIGGPAPERAGGDPHSGLGSNNWVVAGSRTATGRPLLANDMHLSLMAPAIWYENHLCGGGLHVTGISFPGIPGIVTGHNEHLAWGFTNGFPDVQDLYVEHLRRTADGRVQAEFRGEWHDATVLRETIAVKGGRPAVEEVVVTRHGPVINLAETALHGGAPGAGAPAAEPLALRWTSLEPDTLMVSALGMMTARSCAEFHQTLRHWTAPVQNMVYADTAGDIGYSFPGKVPIRARGDGRLPAPGWSGDYEWTGYIPFDELPHFVNPPQGYIATANNRVVDGGYPRDLGLDATMGDRARRIVELISSRDRLDLAFMQQMHFDRVSPLARRVAARIGRLETDDQALAGVVAQMRAWDGRLDAGSAPALVEQVFIRALAELLLSQRGTDGGRSDLIRRLAGFDRTWHWALSILEGADPYWLDLGHGESADDVARLALRRAVDDITAWLGPDSSAWALGKHHCLTFHHPLAQAKALGAFFNRGPYSAGGDGTTVWCTSPEGGLNSPRNIGPPYRMIVDVGDWRRSVSLLAPGQSGRPGSPHYDDQAGAWFSGDYHPMLFDRPDVEREARCRLRLAPAPGR